MPPFVDLEADAGARGRTEQDAGVPIGAPVCADCVTSTVTRAYLRSGMRPAAAADDPQAMGVHRAFPAAWLKVAVVFANLAVWLDALLRIAR